MKHTFDITLSFYARLFRDLLRVPADVIVQVYSNSPSKSYGLLVDAMLAMADD